MGAAYFHQTHLFVADGFNFFNQVPGYLRIPVFIDVL
jgi:hypothetical protein